MELINLKNTQQGRMLEDLGVELNYRQYDDSVLLEVNINLLKRIRLLEETLEKLSRDNLSK